MRPLFGERTHSVVDRVKAAFKLGYILTGAVLESVMDLVTGREVPHPDLKQVASSPEPTEQKRAA